MNKVEQMISYVAWAGRSDPAFGKTKLFKIFFVSDFMRYGETGESISGKTYIHLDNGPVPDGLDNDIRSLEVKGFVTLQQSTYYGYRQTRVVPVSEPETTLLSKEECELIDAVIKKFWPLSGSDLSDWSHQLLPWLLTGDKEEIPYSTVFMWKDRPVSVAAVNWAKSELARLGRN